MVQVILKALKIQIPLYLIIYALGVILLYFFLDIQKEFLKYLWASLFSEKVLWRHSFIICGILILNIFHHKLYKKS